MTDYKSFRLPNGLRVMVRPDHSWPVVTTQAWVRVGSLDEAEAQAGISHVLEHMVFKGSRRYGAAEISRRVEDAGGHLNAETSREYTHYHIDIPKEGAPLAIEMLGELMCRAVLSSAEWKRECPVILEEMRRRFDDPETTVWESLQESLYRDTLHKRPVIGSLETVSALKAEDLQTFYRTHYVGQRSLVVITGDLTFKHAREWVQKAFSAMPKGDAALKRPAARMSQEPRAFKVQRRVKQAYTAYAVPGPLATHQDQEALDLLAVILGDGRNARLVRRLYEEKKLVWSISTTHHTQQTGGMFAIFAECAPQKRRAVDAAVRNEIARLLRTPPSLAELNRAKNLVQTSWLQGFETFHSQAGVVGAYALDHQLHRLKNYLPTLLAIKPSDIHHVAQRYFRHPLASAVVEP